MKHINMLKFTIVTKQFLMNEGSPWIWRGNTNCSFVFCLFVSLFPQPVDELRTAVFDILKKKDEIQGNEVSMDTTAGLVAYIIKIMSDEKTSHPEGSQQHTRENNQENLLQHSMSK